MELRLIVEAADPLCGHSIELEGKHWVLSEPFDLDYPESIPKYSCVSYAWGEKTERVPNPLFKNTTMSTHTIPAFQAAIRAKKSNAFWIDTFCVPLKEPTNRFTLESMGFIYSEASEVVVMLSSTTSEAINQLAERDRLTEEALTSLNQDNWVTRIWTYQEVANAKCYYFVYEGASETVVPIEGGDFANYLGFSLEKLKKEKGIDHLALTSLFPKLSNFEDLLVEAFITPFGQRSALVVMTSIQRRNIDNIQNLFYAMTCAVTRKPSPGLWDTVDQSPAETFMRICEESNDYSFIYSSDERDETPERRWRPKPELLNPIISFHCYGEAQRAHRTAEGICLEGMLSFNISSTIDSEGRDWIINWLKQPDLVGQRDSDLAQASVLRLKEYGFQALPGDSVVSRTSTERAERVSKSSSRYLLLRHGLFVPQRPLEITHILRVIVTNQISWAFGAPGLVEIRGTEGSKYVIGVYIGNQVGLKPNTDMISTLL